jgi:hypothetical protein
MSEISNIAASLVRAHVFDGVPLFVQISITKTACFGKEI